MEGAVEQSVLHSPCCGPTNLPMLDGLQDLDQRLEQISTHPEPLQLLLESRQEPRMLRMLYIPTAMYALRPDSTNTAGKQRQRARADAKKRRNEMVHLLQDLLGPHVRVLAVTLDLDDASLKQPQGSDDPTLFPPTGKDAMRKWKPHLVFVPGGNTFWLHHCMTKEAWNADLVELCTGPAVYCGASAGAICVGKEMVPACWKGWDDPRVVPGMEDYASWKNVPGLGLAGDLSFFPHMENQWQHVVDQKRLDVTSQVLCLRDEDVLCVNGLTKEMNVVSSTRQEVLA